MNQLFVNDKNGFLISYDENNKPTLVDFSDFYMDINVAELNINNAINSYKNLNINNKFLNKISGLKSKKLK